MAKSTSSTESSTESTPAAAPAAAPPAQQPQLQLDESDLVCAYANFCRVTGTPEELIVDFGLNSQPMGTPTDPIKVKQRIVTNFYTAKRMLHALHMAVQRHEQAFGVLETNVQKRVVGNPSAGAAR